MKRVSFIRQTLLRDVKGRIDYISNPARQEHLYATYETNPEPFWDDLAKENQVEFFHSGREGRCVEARELIIALPEQLTAMDPAMLLKTFTDHFKGRYGVECSAALHHNKSMTNYHIHLIYSERLLREDPTRKALSELGKSCLPLKRSGSSKSVENTNRNWAWKTTDLSSPSMGNLVLTMQLPTCIPSTAARWNCLKKSRPIPAEEQTLPSFWMVMCIWIRS